MAIHQPSSSSTDRLEKHVILNATPSRVWRALTDVHQFNAWFGVALTTPIAAGAACVGPITIKGYEHLIMRLWVETLQPETFFSFRWHPNATDMSIDYSNEPTTLVAFTIEAVADGTKLTIVESGFDAVPEARRMQAFTSNSQGWAAQLESINTFIAASAN